jgi:uncharacterized membrane protein
VTLKYSPLDWLLEIVSLAALGAMYGLAAGSWSGLPDVVPTHFGISGTPNSWGDKRSIWLVPAVGLFIYLLLTVSARYPRLVNLPFRVDRNAPEVQRIIFRLLASSKAATMLLLAYIVYGQVQSAMRQTNSLGIAFIPLFLIATIVPFAVYLKQLRRYKQ